MFWIFAPLLGLIAIVILWLGPKLQVASLGADHLARFDKENEARRTLATIVGGVAILATIYSTTAALDTTREGQLTDRYTKAVEQLGASRTDREPNIEVRLGGIYALARIAKDSPRDRETIEQIFTAYMRQNSPASLKTNCKEPHPPRADLQAIVTILGDSSYSSTAKGRSAFDFRAVSFCGYSLANCVFDRSYFTMSDMRMADLRGAKLSHAWLEFVDFRGANLQSTDFSGAILRGAVLSDTDLRGANLTGALLASATLRASQLDESDLSTADLDAADLQGADLSHAHGLCLEQVARAKTNGLTTVPKNISTCEVKP
jgi:hypothetical protein